MRHFILDGPFLDHYTEKPKRSGYDFVARNTHAKRLCPDLTFQKVILDS